MNSLAPALLLSMPQLVDPNFARTVVLLCKHSEEGAFGLSTSLQYVPDMYNSTDEIIAAIDDPELVRDRAEDGRRVVAKRYDWNPLAMKLGECWEAAEIEVASTPVPLEEWDG